MLKAVMLLSVIVACVWMVVKFVCDALDLMMEDWL
jgi:hypothetical protein